MLSLAHLIYQAHKADSLECQQPSSELEEMISDRLRLLGDHYDNIDLSARKRI